ncbi:unnamed protein product [Calypogeia fissa]
MMMTQYFFHPRSTLSTSPWDLHVVPLTLRRRARSNSLSARIICPSGQYDSFPSTVGVREDPTDIMGQRSPGSNSLLHRACDGPDRLISRSDDALTPDRSISRKDGRTAWTVNSDLCRRPADGVADCPLLRGSLTVEIHVPGDVPSTCCCPKLWPCRQSDGSPLPAAKFGHGTQFECGLEFTPPVVFEGGNDGACWSQFVYRISPPC